MEINSQINQYLTMAQLQAKLGGRSRSSILRDVELGIMPKPVKFSPGVTSRSYFSDAEVETALQSMRERQLVSAE